MITFNHHPSFLGGISLDDLTRFGKIERLLSQSGIQLFASKIESELSLNLQTTFMKVDFPPKLVVQNYYYMRKGCTASVHI